MTETLEMIDLGLSGDWSVPCQSFQGCHEVALWARVLACCAGTLDLCGRHRESLEKWVASRLGHVGKCTLCGAETVIRPEMFIWIPLGGGNG